MMNTGAHPYEWSALHRAAAAGDDDGVRYALRSGADVNALDSAGKTALMCAIAGENWQSVDPADSSFLTPDRISTIRTLLNHPKISLWSLNAPHASMNGVVPLGMAAWLNLPRVVRLLLEESADAVSVDAMDSHGATALMYAARDGNLEVVQILLCHGARPDFRDSNYRTSIQFALPHARILWLCEVVLRRHRWREASSADRSQSPISEHILQLSALSLPSCNDLEPPQPAIFNPQAMSRLLTTLVSSIRSGDLDFLHSLLFSPAVPASSPASLYPMSVPILVNFPDSKGWSLIHHAVSLPRPSIDVIDSLYCAGADTALFTAHEQWTPLHILARSATVTPGQHDDAASLYQLVVHLIRDLRAPLSARDKDDETCIHIAAEHGQSLELLTYLLECDKSGTVRQLKNSRGLTPLQVAKPEFLAAFGPDIGILQLITPSLAGMSVTSNDSLATLSDSIDPDSVQDATSSTSSVCSPSQIDATLTSQLLITNLRLSSPDGHHVNEPGHLRKLESILADSRQNQQRLVQYFRDRIKEAETELQELKKNAQRVDFLRETVATAASEKLSSKGIQPLPPKVYHRDSEDSQSTAVSQGSSRDFLLLPSPVSHQAPPRLRINTKTLNGRPSVPTFSSLFQQSESPSPFISPYSSKDNSPLDEDHKVYRDSRLAMFGRRSTPDLRQSKSDSPKKKKKELEQAKGEKGLSGTMRFKAWLKKMVHHEDLTRSQLAADTQKPDPAPLPTIQVSIAEDIDRWDPAIDTALRTSMVVLEAAERDLCNIHLCLNSAEQFIGLANHSVNKVERAMKRAFKLRQQMITKLRSSKPGSRWYNGDIIGPNHSPSSSLFPPPSPIHLRPSIASISSISTQSSVASAAATITEHDDEDTRVIRRLLLRKIEAQSSGAWEELEKALSWLRIVKEVVRGVKRRAYL